MMKSSGTPRTTAVTGSIAAAALLAAAVGLFYYYYHTHPTTGLPANMANSPSPTWNADQQKALSIADVKLEELYPSKENFGIVYQPTFAILESATGTDAIYTVGYALPNGPTDTGIGIMVDITTGTVIKVIRGHA